MSKNILVIDDDELIVKSLRKLLSSQGHNATVVKSGKEAIEEVKKVDFHLIISDIRMPDIDGIETIRRIRDYLKEAGKKPVPEILITGYADESKYKEALDLKVADYIFKPFDITELIDKVKRNLGND
ncbi:MAG: response regulator [Candidatus Omnitrophica bacterium]|nr:response regulator [Candidatus Omnitrophota bacterium]